MTEKLIFNPSGEDRVNSRTIIKGNTTGLFNLNQVKYTWANPLYKIMIGNFWVPEKVSGLREDAAVYPGLTNDEKRSFKGVISFLTFLDSIQTVNIPNISDFITAPEVNLLLSIQSFQEAIHTQSYTTLIESVVAANERDSIYYLWRDDKILLERNQYIGTIYQEFIDCKNDTNFFKVLIANYLLEGLFFYNGFAYFDTLVYHQKMKATGIMINYIRRDELTHLAIFANIIKEVRHEFPEIYNEQIIYKMFRIAVEQEIHWGKHIFGENIIGITFRTINEYSKWLANQRLKILHLQPLYPEVTHNPYSYLEKLYDNNIDRTNFFDATVVNYTQSSSMNGDWDF